MPVPFNQATYPKVQQWLTDNPHDERLPELIKQQLLRFQTLTEPQRVKLQVDLLAIADLPEVLQQFLPDHVGALPVELLDIIGDHLAPQDKKELGKTDKRMHLIFHESNLYAKFLECIAYGQQDKTERLLSQVFDGKPAKIQVALLHQGRLTDYSGRTFHCSAYEYAYWAKDTHMCRMLERYMDDETKAQMLTRIDVIEASGLSSQQNGEQHRSPHFDFTPLKEAYRRYIDGYVAWDAADNWDAMEAAWCDVGKAQRNVPAHVAQEYCREDRSFHPRPEFNETTLPRVLTFYNSITMRVDSWFPLTTPISLFAVARGARCANLPPCEIASPLFAAAIATIDLVAINRLDEVRTTDLMQSREHLNPPGLSQHRSV